MTSNDDERFAALMTTVAVATRTEVDTPTIELYYRALMDVPIELLEAACVPLVQSARFWPKVSEWRLAVDNVLDSRQDRRLGTGNQLQLPGEVGDGRCPACDDTGWKHINVVCDREWRCHSWVEGQEHTHTKVTRCSECKGKRDAAAATKKRYAKPMWWEDKE